MSVYNPQLSCGNTRSNILWVKTRWLHESPGSVIIFFVRLPNRTFPFVFSGETVRLCMGESENPNLRLQSRLELWSRSWHGWFLEQSFQVRNLLYNNIFVDILCWGWDGDRKLSRCLPNTSMFVPNNPLQSHYCVLPIMRCAFGAHLDVGLAERRTQYRFVGNLTFSSLFFGEDGRLIIRFLPSFLGKMGVFDKTESLYVCISVCVNVCWYACLCVSL